jgi:hypothetical protein
LRGFRGLEDCPERERLVGLPTVLGYPLLTLRAELLLAGLAEKKSVTCADVAAVTSAFTTTGLAFFWPSSSIAFRSRL